MYGEQGRPENMSNCGNARFVSLPEPLESNVVLANSEQIKKNLEHGLYIFSEYDRLSEGTYSLGREFHGKSFVEVKTELERAQADLDKLIQYIGMVCVLCHSRIQHSLTLGWPSSLTGGQRCR